MAFLSIVDLAGSGGQSNFTFTSPYIARDHIHVYIDLVETTAFTFASDFVITLDTPLAVASTVRIRRITPSEEALVDFVNGSVLGETDLDTATLQVLYVMQETADIQALDSIRSVRAPAIEVAGILEMPLIANRKNNFLYFDAAGNPTVNAWTGTTLAFSPTVQLLSGTGAQTAFTLSSPPGASAALLVAISGVTQTPQTDFTVSGSTLTFTTAPPVGTSNIMVQNFGVAREVNTVPASGITDPSTISVTATGSTASRTLAAREADWLNVLDYGADKTGVADSTAAFQAAYDAADASGTPATVFFPSGNYLKSSVVTIYGDHITTFAYGAVVNCNGADGFDLDVVDQDYHQFLGMEVYNFLTNGYGIPTTGGANNTLKRWFTVRDCIFRDSTQTNGNIRAIQLSCETYGVKILNNHISNIISTNTGSGFNSYGIIVGKKADSLAGGRTGELGSYGYDNSDIHTAEGSTIISGNTVRKMRSSGGLNTDAVTGILADGWRCVVTNNVVEDIQYIGAGAFGASGVGIYMRGRENICTGNAVAAWTYAGILIKSPTASVTWGDIPNTLVANNTFSGIQTLVNAEAASKVAISVLGPNVSVLNNLFSRVVTGSQGYIIHAVPSSPTGDNLLVAGNTIERCMAHYYIAGSGNNCVIRDNVLNRALSAYTPANGSRFILYSHLTAGDGSVVIEDNVQYTDDAYFDGGSSTQYGVFIECNSLNLHSVVVRRNKFLGWKGAAPTEGVWRLIYASINAATNTSWDLSDNYTDALFRGVSGGASLDRYCSVNIAGGTRPTPIRQRFDFGTELETSAASTLTLIEDESGATFANVGAVAGWAYVLPVALPGLEFGFRKVVAQAMTVDTNGTEIINAGSAGGILTLTNVGSCVYLKCFVAGTWIVTNSNGAYTVA